eukprot:3608795-Alexandrium_andersonii.AAC.1
MNGPPHACSQSSCSPALATETCNWHCPNLRHSILMLFRQSAHNNMLSQQCTQAFHCALVTTKNANEEPVFEWPSVPRGGNPALSDFVVG